MKQDTDSVKTEYDEAAGRFLVWMTYIYPAIICLVSIPMIFELVPPNGGYGYRTAYTLSSPEIWYHENRIAGISLVVVSLIGMVANYLIMRFSSRNSIAKGLFSILLYTFLLIVVVSNLGP